MRTLRRTSRLQGKASPKGSASPPYSRFFVPARPPQRAVPPPPSPPPSAAHPSAREAPRRGRGRIEAPLWRPHIRKETTMSNAPTHYAYIVVAAKERSDRKPPWTRGGAARPH